MDKLPAGAGLSRQNNRAEAGGIENRFKVFDFVFDDDGNLVQLRPLILGPGELLAVKTARAPEVPPPVTVPQNPTSPIVPGVTGG